MASESESGVDLLQFEYSHHRNSVFDISDALAGFTYSGTLSNYVDPTYGPTSDKDFVELHMGPYRGNLTVSFAPSDAYFYRITAYVGETQVIDQATTILTDYIGVIEHDPPPGNSANTASSVTINLQDLYNRAVSNLHSSNGATSINDPDILFYITGWGSSSFTPLSYNVSFSYAATTSEIGGTVDYTSHLNSVSPSGSTAVAPGGTLSLNYNVFNSGTATLANRYTNIYLSTDANITTDDLVIATDHSFRATPTDTVNDTVTLPAGLADGTYYIGVIVDPNNIVTETNEYNNASNAIAITVRTPRPDAIVQSFSFTGFGSNGRVEAKGQPVTFTATIANTGDAAMPAGVKVGFYISQDGNITTSDLLIGTAYLNAMAAGGSQTISYTIPIPAGVGPGVFVLGAIVDYDNLVVESNEYNNALGGAAVEIRNSSADLKAGGNLLTTSQIPAGSSNSNGWGGTLVANVGSAAATNVTYDVFLSTDANVTAADLNISNTFANSLGTSLAPGASIATASVSFTIPYETAAGTYWIAMIADPTGRVADWDLSNNTSAVQQITVLNNNPNVGTNNSDVLFGTTAGEKIYGNAGNDVIYARDGNDTLVGGKGYDVLVGGVGSDAFVFDSNSTPDSNGQPNFDFITDFDRGNSGVYLANEGDVLDISALVSGAYNAGHGQAVQNLVRLVEDANGAWADLQVDTDGLANGVHWVTVGRIAGNHLGETANVLMYNAGTNINGVSGVAQVGYQADAGFVGDFNGDHKTDLLWRNDSGAVTTWLMNNTTTSSASYANLSLDNTWHMAGTGDFNGDGKSDILWHNDNGQLAMWNGNSGAYTNAGTFNGPDAHWTMSGVGDFNGDGKADILWHRDDGTIAVWLMNGTQVLSGPAVGMPDTSWHIVGIGDFNGDNKSDVLLRNDNGMVATWQMNGTQITGGGNIGAPDPSWHVVGVGDFNGDHNSDILWQNDNGNISAWIMSGTTILAGGSIGNPGPSWHVAGVGDANNDGITDLYLRNDNGAVALWDIYGLSVQGGGSVNAPTQDWKIDTHHYDFV